MAILHTTSTASTTRINAAAWDQSHSFDSSTIGSTIITRIPIDLRNPAASTNPGNTFWTVTGLTAWDAGHWEFVSSVNGRIYGIIMIPKNVAGTPNASIILSLAWNTTTNATSVIDVNTTTIATNGVINVASLTQLFTQNVTTVTTALRTRKDITTSTVTVSADQFLIVELVQSSAANVSVNTELYGAWLELTVNT